MFGLGWQEIVVILILALLLFGAKRLPSIAKSMGKSVQEFKKGMDPNAKDDEETGEKKALSESSDKPESGTESGAKPETGSETKPK
jgi:TatA/E family protein of Tat protein translocase